MSRRSRKRHTTGKSRWLMRTMLGLFCLSVIGLGTVYGLVRTYLHSDSFRNFLSDEAGEISDVRGEFSPFHWEGLAANTDSYEAVGDNAVSSVQADDLRTTIGLGGLRRGVWEITDSNIRRLEVSLDFQKQWKDSAVKGGLEVVRKNHKSRRWIPKKVEIKKIDIDDVTVKAAFGAGQMMASGMKLKAQAVGVSDAFRAKITGGRILLPWYFAKELQLERVSLRCQEAKVFLTGSRFKLPDDGLIEAAGELDIKTQQCLIEGEARDIKCENLLNSDWAKRLTGSVNSSFTLGNHSKAFIANGKLRLENGSLTALPVLDVLAAYADTRRFRQLVLTESHADWLWEKDRTTLTNIVIASNGLIRFEGNITIQAKQIDGTFRLGIAPGTLATIPGAETDVFILGERGLLWTPLRITGTLADPKEDLTDRLMKAAGLRMFEQIPQTGEKAIKFTQSMLYQSAPQAVEQGTKILGEGTKAVREMTGILDGILGVGEPTRPDSEEP